jgi:hypothetical protein
VAALATLSWPACVAQAGRPADTERALIEALREEGERFESGNGVPRDPDRAVASYCAAARLGDAESQFRLGWIYTNGRGVERNDTLAAFFFQVASEQGIEQATRMLRMVGAPGPEIPPCMREPAALAGPGPTSVSRSVPASTTEAAAPPDVLAVVRRMAPQFGVDVRLALAIIEAESRFDPVALSNRQAKGLMQLLPETAARFAVANPYDTTQNVRGGLAYLRWLLAYFEGNIRFVAAAYNAGERTVERYRGVPPYLETRVYVQRIVDQVGSGRQPYDPSVTAPSAVLRQLDRSVATQSRAP